MSNKTENIKNFINHVGTENQLFLFAGGNTKDSGSNSTQSDIDTWKDSDFSIKIGKDNVVGVIPNVKWIRSRTYTPWSSTTENTGNFYAYNDNNGYVYICISDNPENRIDFSGKNGSTYIPSHVAGDVTYPDGYTWKAVYKITPNMEKFITDQWLPVVTFDTFEELDKNSPFTQIQNYCSPLSTKDGGKCALYFSRNYQYYDGNGVLQNATKGLFYKSFDNLLCFECYNMFKDHPDFVTEFSASVKTNISIKDPYDLVGELIADNKISTSSPYYYLYTANLNSPDEGYIVSTKIDLSGIPLEDLVISHDNPELTLLSNTGSGGRIRFKTYRSISGKIILNGIELITKGSGYRDVTLQLNSASMLGSVNNATILTKIKINLDEIDGLGFDPMKVLGVKHTMIDVAVEKKTLDSSSLPIPQSINFYTLVQNPKYNSSIEVIAGSNENKYQSTLYRTTTKLNVMTPTVNPTPNKTAFITKSDGRVIRDLKVTKVNPSSIFSPTASASVEVKGLEYTDSSGINGVINIDGVNFSVKDVESSPQFVQYSGKIISSNKTTAIDIADEDTALIRINMVKGM